MQHLKLSLHTFCHFVTANTLSAWGEVLHRYKCKTVKVLKSLLEQAAACFITLGF
jgi:hypothetical protein